MPLKFGTEPAASFASAERREGHRRRIVGMTKLPMMQQPTPTQYRVQYLVAYSTVIAERRAYANDLAGALALVEGTTFSGAVRMRILDAEGHLLHPKKLAP